MCGVDVGVFGVGYCRIVFGLFGVFGDIWCFVNYFFSLVVGGGFYVLG